MKRQVDDAPPPIQVALVELANTQVIDGDVAGSIRRLKESSVKDIVQYGFGPVARLLLEHDLLDELQQRVHPLILGSASPSDLLFGDTAAVGFDSSVPRRSATGP